MPSDRTRTMLRCAGSVASVGLVVAAVVVAVRQVDFPALASVEPWKLALLATGVVVTLALNAGLYWVVTRSFDACPAVGLGRMTEVIAAATLVNYLPLRPGLVGRAVFLKVRHEVPYRQSLWISLIISMLGAVVLVGTAGILLLTRQTAWRWGLALAAMVILSLLTQPVGSRLLGRRIWAAWSWTPLRVADMLVGALRLWLAFSIVGHPMDFDVALLAITAGSFVSLVGVTPNGLGLREWAVAMVSNLAGSAMGPVGLAAALVDRGVEVLVLVPVGLWGLQRLRSRVSGLGSRVSEEKSEA